MELNELFNQYKECTDTKRAYVLLSCMEEVIKASKEQIKPELESDELGVTSFEDLGKEFNLIEMQKATLKIDEIKAQLSDEEIRQVYKPTDKDLTTLKRKDLKELKTVDIVRQIRVSTIKEEVKASA